MHSFSSKHIFKREKFYGFKNKYLPNRDNYEYEPSSPSQFYLTTKGRTTQYLIIINDSLNKLA